MKYSAAFAALAAGAAAHSLHAHQQRSSSVVDDSRLLKRVSAGGKCGAGVGTCDPGLCCSEGGFCGTGGAFCSAPACQLSYGPACDGNQVPSGPDTSKTPRPQLGGLPVGVDITSCRVMGKVALTFDDGPYIYTSELLDVLKKNNVRATFFVVGNNGAKGQINEASSGYIPIIQRMISDGHQIGSHSWSHQDLNAVTSAQRKAQIINNEISLASILGVIPTYFRPPYTSCGSACYADLGAYGYKVVNYDLDTKDWENGGSASKSIYQGIIAQGSPATRAYLALAHDIQEFTVKDFAQFMIDKARGLGYDFVTVGECLGDAPSNWYRDPVTGAGKSLNGGVEPPPPASSQPPTPSSTKTPPKSSSSQPTTTPKSVPPDTDFGLGKGNSTSQRTTTTRSSTQTPSITGTAPPANTTPAGSLGVRATVPLASNMGTSAMFATVAGLLGLMFFALN